MSDILIKGIEMPSDCMDCFLLNRNEEESDGSAADWYCPVTQSWTDYPTACKGRTTDCPLKELIRCKDCMHFEYDHVEQIDGIPLIVAHEICMFWGDGCKTSENGWCFMAEAKEE